VHRDIKSSNVLLKKKENGFKAYLTDFGISKDTSSGNTSATMTRGVLGTADYIPPEQALGQRHLIGARSDIYSLGVVLYEMLCGRVPFKAPTETAIIQKHLNEAPPSPKMFNPKIPISVVRVVMKALEKDPSKRYANTGEFYHALKLSFEESTIPIENSRHTNKASLPVKKSVKENIGTSQYGIETYESDYKWVYPLATLLSILLGILMFFIGQNSQQLLS
jgi:serine/threonine-protein kinase